MMLKEGMYDVPKGHLAAVTTYLDMSAPVMVDTKPFPDGICATQERMDNDSYRALFRAIGAPWLWTSQLLLNDAELTANLHDDQLENWIVRDGQKAIGLIGLDFRSGGECELAFFGMIKEATGQGLGGPMMALAQSQAFNRPIKRFFLHTCRFDDPGALDFYQRAGFRPYKCAIEVFPDPRLGGVHTPETAPQVLCLP